MILVCCGVVGILSRDVHFYKLMGRNLKEKWQNAKVTGIDWQNASKDTWRVEISIASYDVKWEWKRSLYHRKGEEIISDFDSESQKFWMSDLGFFKFVRQWIECSEARVWLRDKLKDLEFPGWGALNPKFSPQKLKNWLTSPNNNCPNPVFDDALSKQKILRNPEPIFWFMSA